MKAILVDPDTQAMHWADTADPVAGPDDLLVDVRAAALNRADLMQRAGHYPPPPGASSILGLEVAGVVAKVGANVAGWSEGDRVCALLPGGGYAERAAIPAAVVMPMPAGWSFADGAALPEVYLTAFVNLYMEADLQPGEAVLVHGGASGVGTAAIQLLQATENPVYVTAGSPEKCAACRRLGATAAIDYKQEDWPARLRELTGGAGVDVIMDMVGAPYLVQNLALLKPRGRLVFISTLGGGVAELDIRTLMGKRIRLIGSVLRPRTLSEKVAIKTGFMDRFWPLVEAGAIKPIIDAVYPIREVEAAHQQMAENRNIGKIVLTI